MEIKKLSIDKLHSEIQPEIDKDDGTLNIISYQRINKKYGVRLTGPLLSAFSDPAEYEDFIRRIDVHLRKKIKERNE